MSLGHPLDIYANLIFDSQVQFVNFMLDIL